jgi:hypothetical protein
LALELLEVKLKLAEVRPPADDLAASAQFEFSRN